MKKSIIFFILIFASILIAQDMTLKIRQQLIFEKSVEARKKARVADLGISEGVTLTAGQIQELQFTVEALNQEIKALINGEWVKPGRQVPQPAEPPASEQIDAMVAALVDNAESILKYYRQDSIDKLQSGEVSQIRAIIDNERSRLYASPQDRGAPFASKQAVLDYMYEIIKLKGG